MNDYLAQFFLLFSNLYFILLIITLGFFKGKRALFFQLACLGATEIIINVALKGTFQIPLAPALNKVGYAFPSGHMQFATVFYVWLALHFSSKSLKLLTTLILMGIGYGLIHFGYHNITDILGGVFFALLLMGMYYYAIVNFARALPWLLFVITSLLMVYNLFHYQTIPTHAWIAYVFLCLLLCAERTMFYKNQQHFCWYIATKTRTIYFI